MRTAFAGLVLGIAARSAAAQPGQTPSWTSPSGPPGLQPPYAYRPQGALTEEERDILATGEIGGGQIIIGGVGALFLGFGVGQAFEGRWHDTGWIFTLGEAASISVLFAGITSTCFGYSAEQSCRHGDLGVGLFAAGLIAFGGFRLWEIGDAFTGPFTHNDRLHEIRRRLDYPDAVVRITPYVSVPRGRGDGGAAGLTLRF